MGREQMKKNNFRGGGGIEQLNLLGKGRHGNITEENYEQQWSKQGGNQQLIIGLRITLFEKWSTKGGNTNLILIDKWKYRSGRLGWSYSKLTVKKAGRGKKVNGRPSKSHIKRMK